ncbi:MAG: class I SAM-dependent methyltransferase, partial [Actinobacteria bacterium]|nr:class I SAM-dependent methyltransferase [Actinomycetota bacterium]
YDIFDSDRSDLDLYTDIVTEFDAQSVLDIGCGTGTLSCLLAGSGIDVTGVDPAKASLEVASTKKHAGLVRWIHGDATNLPAMTVDLATMTANVAQVFVTDSHWLATLRGIGQAVRPGGMVVFETRDPAKRAWERWTEANSRTSIDIPNVGVVESWVDVTDVSLPLVTFRHTYCFEADGAVLTSDSTLRFRDHGEVESSLSATGWTVVETRDAPDRPGREFVFLATNAQ